MLSSLFFSFGMKLKSVGLKYAYPNIIYSIIHCYPNTIHRLLGSNPFPTGERSQMQNPAFYFILLVPACEDVVI